jgi:hypothetical protein
MNTSENARRQAESRSLLGPEITESGDVLRHQRCCVRSASASLALTDLTDGVRLGHDADHRIIGSADDYETYLRAAQQRGCVGVTDA